jgi:hypothetical protein
MFLGLINLQKSNGVYFSGRRKMIPERNRNSEELKITTNSKPVNKPKRICTVQNNHINVLEVYI